MDTERKIQYKFLDEAEDCYDTIEGVLLDLATNVAAADKLDEALRAAHSVKGGAAMMGLADLSSVAHRFEDSFKILRIHHASQKIETELETLLLQGLDCLRQVGNRYRKATELDQDWLIQDIHPVFDQLQTILGNVTDADEDALLAQEEEETDPALILFEDGVETVLDRIEAQVDTLTTTQLTSELAATAAELMAFGHMAHLDAFIELCQTVQQGAEQVKPEQIPEFAQSALKTWRRSHALVLRRRFEKLPSQLADFSPIPNNELAPTDPLADVDSFANALESFDVEMLQADFSNLELPSTEKIETSLFPTAAELADALGAEPLPQKSIEDPATDEFSAALTDFDQEALTDLQDVFAIDPLEISPGIEPLEESAANTVEPFVLTVESAAQALQQAAASIKSSAPSPQTTSGKTVRIPVEQLEQFNTLFGKLVLERNTVNLRLGQLQTFTNLMQQRIRQLETSNTQLQQWYDRASMEGIIPAEDAVDASSPTHPQTEVPRSSDPFDTLEMDRYTDLHLIAQEQIETIVQLQEVGTDVNLTVQEMGQAVRDLNQTTRSLQSNMTKTQMVPFGELVKRFPRVIRELGLQQNKPTQLNIEGESTLIDRAAVEALSKSLNQLLRNAFDHGIGSQERRLSIGKPAKGTITIKARNQGTQTTITLSDDGAGIQLEKVRNRLKEMGLTDAEVAQMSEPDLLDCIFEPGFSTAEQVTELSGRGIGMDIVRTTLRDINSEVHVETQSSIGTTFSISIPYTLSILQVMLLEHSGLIFAVPGNSIRELLSLDAEQLQHLAQSQRITWQDQSIPVINLTQHWQFNHTQRFSEMQGVPVINHPTVLVVGEGNTMGGFEIDRFWGEQEVTIRTIASPLPLPKGFGSSTVLGDGRVVPIIDPTVMMQWCLEQPESGHPAQKTLQGEDSTAQVKEISTILVVDDSVNVRRFLANTLEKAGYRVEQAKDGQEAVDKLEGGLTIQAVVCDIEMPRLDGYGVLEEVKGQSRFEDLPIIMLTSRSHDKHRKIAMNLGAAAYFSKPFNEQDLLQTLADFIAKPASESVG